MCFFEVFTAIKAVTARFYHSSYKKSTTGGLHCIGDLCIRRNFEPGEVIASEVEKDLIDWKGGSWKRQTDFYPQGIAPLQSIVMPARTLSPKQTLCLSERFGLKAYMRGKHYDVKLSEPLCYVPGCSMPTVEKDLLYRYFYANTHSGRALIRGVG